METKITLIRHGETEWNKIRKIHGQKDIDLNKKGLEQARKTGEYLVLSDVDCIYSSDLKRAYNTAREIAVPHNVKVKKLTLLRERDFGRWDGKNEVIIDENRKSLFTSPPGGESLEEFQKRIIKAYKKVIDESSGKNIFVVTHRGCIRVLLTYILNMPLEKFLLLDIANLSISKILYKENYPELILMNSTYHL